MIVSLSQLLEESFQIAWDYLERTGELGDAEAASRFLSDTIEMMLRRGQRNRLALSNRAIGAYQRYQTSGAAVSNREARSNACRQQLSGAGISNEPSLRKRTGH